MMDDLPVPEFPNRIHGCTDSLDKTIVLILSRTSSIIEQSETLSYLF